MNIIRYNQLKKILNISRSTLDRWEKSGNFPKRRILGENSIGWIESEINEWLNNRQQKDIKND
jgi:prophage regulatory protein